MNKPSACKHERVQTPNNNWLYWPCCGQAIAEPPKRLWEVAKETYYGKTNNVGGDWQAVITAVLDRIDKEIDNCKNEDDLKRRLREL